MECLKFDEAYGRDIRNGNKIARSDIGEIARTKNKQVLNLFTEGTKLIEKFQGAGKTFTNNHTNQIAHEIALNQNPEMPKIVIQRGLSKTRISVRRDLLRVVLRIKREL